MPPRKLSRDLVLATAVRYADENGTESLSMRRLATELSVAPMALYKHVADKEHMLRGMVDIVIDECLRSSSSKQGGRWKSNILGKVTAARRVVMSHPWATQVLYTRVVRTDTVLRYMNDMAVTFMDGGISADLTHHAMHMLGPRMWGITPELFATPDGHTELDDGVDVSQYPAIVRIAVDTAKRRPGASSCDSDFEFSFAVTMILDSVEKLHESGWQST